MAIEILSWSLRVSAPPPEMRRISSTAPSRDVPAIMQRAVFDAGEARRCDYGVHDRGDLEPGDFIKGPALIVEAQTTTVVTARFDATIDGARNIVLTRKALA